ncbi:hypothetical protein Vadar_018503 [Vaccinium darrowii]|uniref:Uncharacterized protein n=1 Tax=Vaccinium darrowii TaxID=229202 RepID=A0ACB7Y1F1_9ERIC|nr:hypothetical protein Vadar_018503 [Vaccinium darrowii]
MSETRDYGESLDDREAKKSKYSDPTQQQEDKAKEGILTKGNELSLTANPPGQEIEQKKQEKGKIEGSTDAQQGSDFDQMIEMLFRGEIVAPVLTLKKQEIYRPLRGGGGNQNPVFSISESRDSSEYSFPLDDSEPTGILLFEVQHNQEWQVSFTHYTEEKAFMIVKGWKELSDWHNWDHSVVIGFYKPVPLLSINHFLVKFQRMVETLPKFPEFRRENFLFQIELTTSDIGYSRLFMHSKEVEIHFPAIKHVPKTKRKKEIVRFTDAKNKDWYMDVVYYNANSYMIIKEWEEFVKERNLVARDVIKFYKPVVPLHLRHFLIEIVRKDAATNPRQPCAGGPSSNSGYKGKEKIVAG